MDCLAAGGAWGPAMTDMINFARLAQLLLRPEGLNAFEAGRLGVASLSHRISILESEYGVAVLGQWEWVDRRIGGKTRVMRYKIVGAEARAAARELIQCALGMRLVPS